MAHGLLDVVDGDLSRLTGPLVTQAAKNGDPAAVELFEDVGRWLGVGLANLAAAFDPGLFVIGGGVSEAGEQLFGPLRERVRERVRMLPPEKINILQASLGGDSALHGAVILGQAARERRPEQTS